MDLAQRIQAKTDNGDLIIDFLIEVMREERPDFKLRHRLDAARLLTKYGCNCRGPALAQRDEGIAFILDNPHEPSQHSKGSNSPGDTEFDQALAQKIRESTDDGATVCRFLINVMEGNLKTFKPHHRIQAARELLTRGFDKHADSRRSGGGRNPEEAGRGENQEHQPTPSHTSQPSTQPTKSEKSPNQTNQSSDNNPTQYTPEDDDWSAFIELVTPILDEDDRIKAELAKQDPDPDNPPYERDLSAYDQAWENSEKWFYEWKNSLDPEEYEAIVARELGEFNAMIDTKIERRKQIKAERERREKEEAELQSAEVEEAKQAESTPAPEPGPPTRSNHRRKLMFTLGNSIYIDCGHTDCRLHDEDRGRFRGSVQYGAGPNSGHFP